MEVSEYSIHFFDETKTFTHEGGMFSIKYQERKYSDIMRVDYLEDNETVSSGGFGLGRAIVGGALFGTAGAVVGGLSKGRTSKTYLSEITIVVTMREGKSLTIEFSPKQREKALKLYEQFNHAIELVQKEQEEIEANHAKEQEFIQAIKEYEERLYKEEMQELARQIRESDNYVDEIHKLKRLLDEGLITEEEFSLKKKSLLGIAENVRVKKFPIE